MNNLHRDGEYDGVRLREGWIIVNDLGLPLDKIALNGNPRH